MIQFCHEAYFKSSMKIGPLLCCLLCAAVHSVALQSVNKARARGSLRLLKASNGTLCLMNSLDLIALLEYK